MSAALFTPGPWSLGRRSGREYFRYIDGAGWTDLARVVVRLRDTDFDKAEGVANAHLIAGAPDLFAACNEAFDFLGGVDGAANIRAKLLSAIQLARGQS